MDVVVVVFVAQRSGEAVLVGRFGVRGGVAGNLETKVNGDVDTPRESLLTNVLPGSGVIGAWKTRVAAGGDAGTGLEDLEKRVFGVEGLEKWIDPGRKELPNFHKRVITFLFDFTKTRLKRQDFGRRRDWVEEDPSNVFWIILCATGGLCRSGSKCGLDDASISERLVFLKEEVIITTRQAICGVSQLLRTDLTLHHRVGLGRRRWSG
ncbi:hypothetical protein CVT26_007022 [Gymnopilus dilepis]|uniref:Uncharacterized protein n=1 Tax=Gymnopilus dilepis TaxID=231916 RepID=A0A409W062_9AGAR|nr:hypothetical protein CVT26_007022 [Gymnopilus dilepis]